jgi:hypothetical protein
LLLSLYGACADAQAKRYRQSPDTLSKLVFHGSDTGTRRAFRDLLRLQRPGGEPLTIYGHSTAHGQVS